MAPIVGSPDPIELHRRTESTGGLLDLATNIMSETTRIANHLAAHGLPEPTFDPGSADLPETDVYAQIRSRLLSSLEDLYRLVDGPRRSLRALMPMGNDLAALQVAFDFGFFRLVPLPPGDIAVRDLADRAGLDVDRTARFMRMLATHRIFREQRPGHFSHTASSAIYHQDENFHCSGHYLLDEMWKGATVTSDTLKSWPHVSDSTHCPFYRAHGATLFEYYERNPSHASRYAQALRGVTSVDRQFCELRDKFDWNRLEGTVVDIGGGTGHVSVALARQFPHLNFVVQDQSPAMLAAGKNLGIADLSDRISFMEYNFFEPQPLRNISAFFIRQCTINWCDRDVVAIFKAIVPGLEGSAPGTPLLINDTIMPEPGERPLHEERAMRQIDIIVMVALGSKQRTLAEFESLLREADRRYEIRSVHAGGSMGLLEVHLRSDGNR
ncbi:S-adenosyl-L-methionine-dependent methyltransferase [Xylariomycetidae sp. FL2044]|nr:S-adenosyl-L-methionine-dependent methyltransferase [Xylariomycetidae sp. FL2044]